MARTIAGTTFGARIAALVPLLWLLNCSEDTASQTGPSGSGGADAGSTGGGDSGASGGSGGADAGGGGPLTGGTGGAAGSAGAPLGGAGGDAGDDAGSSIDLAIGNGRFVRGGAPFFPVGNFLTSENGSGPRTHTYLSDEISDPDREHMLSVATAAGYNVFSIYTYNENDYQGEDITPFANGGFGGAVDQGKLDTWKVRVQRIVDVGLHPIIWLVPDDAPQIHAASTDALKSYIAEMVAHFDDGPVLWILALEADEYWDGARVQDLGTHLAGLTVRPVGVHQVPDHIDYMQQSWADFGAYQFGFGKSWQTIFDTTVQHRAALGKPLIAMEYDLQGGDNDDRLGLAAAFGGAHGVGNGAPSGLAAFMAALPGAMTSSRTDTHAQLAGGGVTAAADMGALTFQTQ